MLSHRKGVLLDGIGSELVRSSAGGRRKTLSSWLGAAGDMTVTATGGDTLTLAEWFKWQARGTDAPSSNYGYFSDRATNGDTAFPLKMRHQLALGAGADEDFNTTGGQTWLSTSFDHYFARSATLLSISPMGGAGGVFATRSSDVYDGNAVWTTGEAVTVGAKRGYRTSAGNRALYTATTSGTTGATPPTHTSGTASDGTVTWQFTQLQMRTPMGVASLAYNDAGEGGAAWAGYLEAVRGPSAGDTVTLELDIQNAGSNVAINPYSMFAAGLSTALWVTCQQNVYGPAATAPASAALGIVGNAAGGANYRFKQGIVFHSSSLTDEGGGVYVPLAIFEGCHIRQYNSAGTVGSSIQFGVTANNERVSLNLQNRAVYAYSQGAVMGGFESAPAAGTAPDNYIALSAHANSDGYVQARAAGTGTNVILSLASKGAADVHILREDSSTNTAPHVMSVRRRSTGTPATGIGGALTFDTETAADNMEIGGKISSIFTSVTSTAEVADMLFSVMTGGASADRLRLTPTALQPETDQQITLGTASKSFGNVFACGKALWRPLGVSGVLSSVTGTTSETIVGTVTIPAGAMGANGALRISALWSNNSSGNNHTFRIRLGGIGGTVLFLSQQTTNTLTRDIERLVHNRNSQSSQVTCSDTSAAVAGLVDTATTAAVDTSAAVDLVFTVQLANSGDTGSIEAYSVDLLYQV